MSVCTHWPEKNELLPHVIRVWFEKQIKICNTWTYFFRRMNSMAWQCASKWTGRAKRNREKPDKQIKLLSDRTVPCNKIQFHNNLDILIEGGMRRRTSISATLKWLNDSIEWPIWILLCYRRVCARNKRSPISIPRKKKNGENRKRNCLHQAEFNYLLNSRKLLLIELPPL